MSILYDPAVDGPMLRLQIEQTMSSDPNRAFTTRELHELALRVSPHHTYERVYRVLFKMWTADQQLISTRHHSDGQGNTNHRYWMWRGHAQLADGRVVRA